MTKTFRKQNLGRRTQLFAVFIEKDGTVTVEIAGTVSEDPGPVGLILADCARHYADLYKEIFRQDPQVALDRILEVFRAESGNPTTSLRGEFRAIKEEDDGDTPG